MPKVEEQFKQVVNKIAKELEIQIIYIECQVDYAYLFLDCPPTISPSEIMQKIKRETGRALRETCKELASMPNVWTRNYLVSTRSIDSKCINEYVLNQKTRYS